MWSPTRSPTSERWEVRLQPQHLARVSRWASQGNLHRILKSHLEARRRGDAYHGNELRLWLKLLWWILHRYHVLLQYSSLPSSTAWSAWSAARYHNHLLYLCKVLYADHSSGIGTYRDFGVVTLLLQSDVPGLEILEDEAQDWYLVPPIEGACIVTMVSLFEQWRNDKYISNVHRVINCSGKERYSIPFNYNGNPGFINKCIE